MIKIPMSRLLALQELGIDIEELEALFDMQEDALEVVHQIEEDDQEKEAKAREVEGLEKYKFLRSWPVARESGELLYKLVRYLRPETILELGTSFGSSGIYLASAAAENGSGELITVEVSKLKHDQAEKNFRDARVDEYFRQEKMAADQYLKKLSQPVDFVFLDCDRSRYSFYLDQLLPYLKRGSILVADNAIDRSEDIKAYREKISTMPQLKTVLLEIGDGLLISRLLK